MTFAGERQARDLVNGPDPIEWQVSRAEVDRHGHVARALGKMTTRGYASAVLGALCFAALLAPPAGCKRPAESARAPTAVPMNAAPFVDVAAHAGIRHTHHKPVLDHKLDNIMSWVSSVGAAAAAVDFDNDGWIDLYVTDSRKGEPNYLYRNNGDRTFTDVAKRAGVADLNGETGVSMDCLWGDYDNDGWSDLYLVRWGRDSLFHNNGDGTFTEVTANVFTKRDGSPGIDWANGNAAVLLDYNLDGRLDIYVGNYFDAHDLWNLTTTRIMHDDFETARNAGPNFLYTQQADGTFVENAERLGLDDRGWTLAVGSADIDNDGWPDLYCADDFGPDQLFLNNRDGTFRNVSEEAIGPDSKKGMNVDFGDFNNDGWLDIYVTNITTAEYLQEGNMLWHNNGPMSDRSITLTDISLETGTYDGGWGWGAKFLDYDNDGDLDIIAANGFISAAEGDYWYDLASWTVLGQASADAANWPAIGDRSFSGYEKTRLFQNDGFYAFTQRASALGLDGDRDGRGVVVFDYDNDGDLDLYVANQNQPPYLYRNDRATDRHWLVVTLEPDSATPVNRSGIGTRLTAVTAAGTQIRERDGGNGFSGQSDPRLHFGLGSESTVQLLEVRWPDGGLQYLENVAADQFLVVHQDPSRYAEKLAVAVGPPKPWKPAASDEARNPPRPPDEQIERMLAELEQQIVLRPAEFTPASLYRARCAQYDRHDRAIRFFEKLIVDRPEEMKLRIELACAYVDKIPTCGGVAAVVCKGTLARKSLDQLDQIIAHEGSTWVTHYTRGMNHLHWPRALRHSDDAAADLEECVRLQRATGNPAEPAHFVRAHVALGDALAKTRAYANARRAWADGIRLFPESAELKARLAIDDDAELLEYVEEQRSLERPIDTGLAFLDQMSPSEASAHAAP